MAIDLGDAPVGTPPTTGEQTQILTALGGTTVGRALFQVSNPSAIRFPKVNADNSVTLRSDSDMRSDLGLIIGTNVQAYDADLTTWAGVTRASGFDTFAATPSSANLISLLTDETGTGSAVFSTSPTLTTPNIGAANGTSLSLGGGADTGSSMIVVGSNGDGMRIRVNSTTANNFGALSFVVSSSGTANSFSSVYGSRIDASTMDLGLRGRLVHFGGNGSGFAGTSSFPALKRNGTTLEARLADDSGYAPFTASNFTASGNLITATQTPASASATGTTGTITWDSNYIYICTATNTWKRVAIASW